MRELTARQADDIYELINERAGRSLVLTNNRSPVDWYPLFPNPVVAESLLDRLINTSHQVFERPQLPAEQTTTEYRRRQQQRGHRLRSCEKRKARPPTVRTGTGLTSSALGALAG